MSNLTPVSSTLISLCLSDQLITKMENLNLPNLRELFLHRNKINEIENLQFCPKLRKLWIFQVREKSSLFTIIYLNFLHLCDLLFISISDLRIIFDLIFLLLNLV